MIERVSIRSQAPRQLSVPFFWPMAAGAEMIEQGFDLYARNLKFIAEEQKITHELRPQLATANRVVLDLRTMLFRDYSAAGATGIATVVDAPYAGHSADQGRRNCGARPFFDERLDRARAIQVARNHG